MILDRLMTFSGTGTGGTPNYDTPTATGATIANNIIDLGLFGIPYTATAGQVNSLPGGVTGPVGAGARDIGVGDDPMLKLLVEVVTAFVGVTSLSVALQGAPDNGNTPGAFTTMWQSPAPVLLAGLTQGVYLANVDVPRQIPGQPMPRYLQLQYTIAGGPGTGGAVYAGIVIDRWDQPWGPTSLPSGYPPGVVVPN